MSEAKKVPEACIQKTKGNDYAFCGKEIRPNDFVFTDIDYTLQHYVTSTVVRACSGCVETCQQRLKSSVLDLTPQYKR